MAGLATLISSEMAELVPSKKGRTRKPLKPKNPSSNEINILAGNPTQEPFSPSAAVEKENGPKILVRKSKSSSKQQPSAEEIQDIRGKLEQLRLEKEQTEELLKQRDELLKQKQEELEIRAKVQEKLESELKMLQRLKEFKPTMRMPLVQSLRAKEQEKKQKTKKPSPAYILWCKDQWNQIKKDNPEAEFKQMGNILGAKWKNLSAEEKKPYEEKYQADKEPYLQMVGKEKRQKEALMLLEEEQKQKMALELLEQYLEFKQVSDKENKKKKKKKGKDPLKPKQTLTAFFLFSRERRRDLLVDNKNILEVAKAAGEEWKNMTEEQRAPFEEIAKKQKEQYLQELEIYKQKKAEEAAIIQRDEKEQIEVQKQEALQLLKRKEKTENIIKKTKETQQRKKKQREPNKPKKPATSFLLFSKETRKHLLEERAGISNSTLNALISVRWKELNEEEKQIWNAKAAVGMEVYKKEMEEYNKSRVAENIQQP